MTVPNLQYGMIRVVMLKMRWHVGGGIQSIPWRSRWERHKDRVLLSVLMSSVAQGVQQFASQRLCNVACRTPTTRWAPHPIGVEESTVSLDGKRREVLDHHISERTSNCSAELLSIHGVIELPEEIFSIGDDLGIL